ncbi:hypothetical protein B4092_4787 [Bacillus licheniformis]|nr:hypothetical protein B4092_4787 [Bacillus licheniformis]TWN76602.1 hypothetical protein CHCC20494_0665 [Bacillus licheniformis]
MQVVNYVQILLRGGITEHIEAMMEAGDGATIWGYVDAKLLRELLDTTKT